MVTTNAFLIKSKKPALFVSNLNLNSLSDSIDRVPVNVVARTSVAFPNLPSGPKVSSKAFIVSSVDTVAPALKPNKALTPLSLNTSAAAIPPANALCICSAVCLKSNPVTAATLPVIFNIRVKSSASFATTARFPDAVLISCSENGTLAAKLIKLLKAFVPSLTLPNKKLNLMPRFSTSLPTLTSDLIAIPPPIPIRAD